MLRRWLYMAAVRLLREPEAKAWYERKRQRDEGRPGRGPRRRGKGGIGLVALMRRLLRAVWHVTTKRQAFDVKRLFGAAPARRQGGRRLPAAAAKG